MPAILTPLQFIQSETQVQALSFIPEIKLHLAHEAVALWQKTEEELGEMGLPPPFWGFAWAGGQALARYVLDQPHLVQHKQVLDLASGSGLVGIAAALAGACPVMAVDIDEFACAATHLNAQLNGVNVEVKLENLLTAPPPLVAVILVGDLFYEKSLAALCYRWLKSAQEQGSLVLIGDPSRSYLPIDKLQEIAQYSVPVSREVEDSAVKITRVWQLKP